jgi:membrane-bound serine protease (ClpP class)
MTTMIIIIFLCGILAMVVEIFVPGGILGTLGLLAVVGSIIWAFVAAPTWLVIVLLAASIAFVPLFLYLWKHFVGRIFVLRNTDNLTASPSPPADIVGNSGKCITPLHPSGLARIDGHRLDVVTRGEMLEKGTPVVVIEMAGNRVIVKAQTPDSE